MYHKLIFLSNNLHCNESKINFCLNKLTTRVYSSSKVTSVPNLKMNNNKTIPALGLGTWQVKKAYVIQ